MAWSEVKYALNSTVGTDDFKSLDMIIRSMKSLTASNNFYMQIKGETNYNADVIVQIGQSLKMFTAGSCNVVTKFSLSSAAAQIQAPMKVFVYINDTVVQTFSNDSSQDEDFSANISWNENDVIKFVVDTPLKKGGIIKYLNLNADLIDTSCMMIG